MSCDAVGCLKDEAKKNERAEALKKVKLLCKEFGFVVRMLKGAPGEGRRNGE